LLHYQKKYSEALPFLIASADRGEPRAQYLLATELFNGVNIEKDWIRAYAMMTRAASGGIAPASRSLALMDQYIPAEQRQAGILRASALDQSADGAPRAQVDGLALDSPSLEPVTPAPVSMGVAVSAKRASDTVTDAK
jgi:TPR repeat protein